MTDVNAKITVIGTVQGVGYRWFADRAARKYDLKGFVENLPDGSVYLEVEGKKKWIEDFIKHLHKGPNLSRVEDILIEWSNPHHLFINFKIKA
ncbi:MAG: acylphosphatase [Bacteriovoracaceae bacterium]